MTMTSTRSILLVLLFALLPATTACVCPPWFCGFEDGDRERVTDDDREEDRVVGDDDDAADDDDTAAPQLDALSFAISFEATAAAPGDDDDSAVERRPPSLYRVGGDTSESGTE